eukprot:PhM_4_TR10511/c0_g1_i1/m.15723
MLECGPWPVRPTRGAGGAGDNRSSPASAPPPTSSTQQQRGRSSSPHAPPLSRSYALAAVQHFGANLTTAFATLRRDVVRTDPFSDATLRLAKRFAHKAVEDTDGALATAPPPLSPTNKRDAAAVSKQRVPSPTKDVKGVTNTNPIIRRPAQNVVGNRETEGELEANKPEKKAMLSDPLRRVLETKNSTPQHVARSSHNHPHHVTANNSAEEQPQQSQAQKTNVELVERIRVLQARVKHLRGGEASPGNDSGGQPKTAEAKCALCDPRRSELVRLHHLVLARPSVPLNENHSSFENDALASVDADGRFHNNPHSVLQAWDSVTRDVLLCVGQGVAVMPAELVAVGPAPPPAAVFRLRSPYLARYHGYFHFDDDDSTNPFVMCVTPRRDGRAVCPILQHLRRHRHHDDPHERLRYCMDVALGLTALHKNNILHKRLDVSTVFVRRASSGSASAESEKSVAVLYDYAVHNDAPDVMFTSPEGLRTDAVHTRASDVWALGIVVLAIMLGRVPNADDFRRRDGVGSARLWEHVVQPCLQVKPEDRPDALDIAKAISDTILNV